MKLLGAVILVLSATAILLYAQDYELLLEGNYADFQQLDPQTFQNHEFTFVRLIYNGRIPGYLKNWYTDYPKAHFHFFNDNREWNQMDKAGHLWTTYQVSRISGGLWKWTGLSRSQSAWLGGIS